MHNAKECTNCKNTFPIDNLAEVCPACSHTAFKLVTIGEYWFDLAESFEYPRTVSAAVLVRDFFDVWDVKVYKTFGDFMRAEVLA